MVAVLACDKDKGDVTNRHIMIKNSPRVERLCALKVINRDSSALGFADV